MCSPEGITRLLTELTIILAGNVPEENCRLAIDRFDQLLVQFGHPQRPKFDDESAELVDELREQEADRMADPADESVDLADLGEEPAPLELSFDSADDVTPPNRAVRDDSENPD